MEIGDYIFPDDLLYDQVHNWARVEGKTAIIGLSDFGQEIAGEILYAELPRVGRDIVAGEPFMSLESGKWVGRIKAIVSGRIIEANQELEWESTLINADPYGEGWLAKVELNEEPQGLLRTDDPTFAELIEAERTKYSK
ncbi:MAG: glycine cleavage system protein H [Anaerolineae bacterium]|nr:glycine cleavage system protein H [Anaerolineae bacterium]